MNDLNLSSVELVASPRIVPLNGAPKSADFNAFQKEALKDLSDLATFINEGLLPILNVLPVSAAAGLDGAALYANRSSDNPLFRDAQGNVYTVAEVLSKVSGAQDALAQQLAEVQARIRALQTRLATTTQNDLRASVQSIQDATLTVSRQLTEVLGDVVTQGARLSGMRRMVVDLEAHFAGTYELDVVFAQALPNNDYAVALTVEGAGITIASFVKQADGAGLTVSLVYDGTEPTGKLHVLAQTL